MNGVATRPPTEVMLRIRPRARAKSREERLGDRHLANQVDLELAAQVVERQRLDRPGDRSAGVVDQRPQSRAPHRVLDARPSGGDLIRVGDVELHRLEVPGRAGFQCGGVGLAPIAGEDTKTALSEVGAHARPIPLDAPVITTVLTTTTYPSVIHPPATGRGRHGSDQARNSRWRSSSATSSLV